MDYAIRASDHRQPVSTRERITATLRAHILLLAVLALAAGVFGAERLGAFQNIEESVKNFVVTNLSYKGAKLSAIHITGTQRLPQDEIVSTLSLSSDVRILTLDLLEIQHQLEALSWVKTATISRRLDGQLNVEILERVPEALWQINGQVWLVDAEGVQITQQQLEEFSTLPYLVGSGAASAFPELKTLLADEPLLTKKVQSAVRVGERRWDLLFENGARVRLPEMAEGYGPATAWKRFAGLDRDHQLLQRDVAIFDMRFSDRMIVTLTNSGKRNLGKQDEAA